MRKDGDALDGPGYASSNLRRDREVVLAAVKSIRSNRDVVLTAVQKGIALHIQPAQGS